MKGIFQRFFSPTKLCDMPRFQCAACSDLGVRLTPISLCDMLRFMQLIQTVQLNHPNGLLIV